MNITISNAAFYVCCHVLSVRTATAFQVIYFQCIYMYLILDLQHFVCSHCEKPFEGRRHYEKKGLAYCERDYKVVSDLSADTTSVA